MIPAVIQIGLAALRGADEAIRREGRAVTDAALCVRDAVLAASWGMLQDAVPVETDPAMKAAVSDQELAFEFLTAVKEGADPAVIALWTYVHWDDDDHGGRDTESVAVVHRDDVGVGASLTACGSSGICNRGPVPVRVWDGKTWDVVDPD